MVKGQVFSTGKKPNRALQRARGNECPAVALFWTPRLPAPAHCSPLLSSQRTAAAKTQQTFRFLDLLVVGFVSFGDFIHVLGPYSGSKWIICFLSIYVFALSSTILNFHLPNVIGVHCLLPTTSTHQLFRFVCVCATNSYSYGPTVPECNTRILVEHVVHILVSNWFTMNLKLLYIDATLPQHDRFARHQDFL